MSGKDLIIPCPACDAANSLADGQDAKGARCNACASPLFTGHPIHLTAERFNAHALAKGLPLVIDFWASWCGPCQTMAPIFEALAAEFEPMVRFSKVNTDAEKELAHYFRIQSIPTLSFIRNQREAARVAGVLYPGDLRRWLMARSPSRRMGKPPHKRWRGTDHAPCLTRSGSLFARLLRTL